MISILRQLLADNPSIKAAMRAGKRTGISCKVIKADGSVDDLGRVSSLEGTWAEALRRLKGRASRVIVRFKVNGREYERVLEDSDDTSPVTVALPGQDWKL